MWQFRELLPPFNGFHYRIQFEEPSALSGPQRVIGQFGDGDVSIWHAVEIQKRTGRGGSFDRGKTVTKPIALKRLGKASSEKQIPQVIENPESGANQKELLEPVGLRVKQAL